MATLILDRILNETIRNLDVGRPGELLSAAGSSSSASSSSSSSASLASSDSAVNRELDERLLAQYNAEMGQKERIFWIIIFSFMVLIAAGGNIIVIYIVSTNKEMKSVTNYFLVNLSAADTMVSLLNVVFNFISMLLNTWLFGEIYCKISNFIAILSISASVFTLTAISCDRYNAIIHPLRPRMSHRHAIGWILLIWTLSSALATPNALYSTLLEDHLLNDNLAVTCSLLWPDGRYPLSSYDHIYNIVILVVTYLVPILTMAILYYRVGKELWGYEAIGENVDKQRRAIMAKKKIVKMMIVVVIIFALCWFPYHAFFVVNYYLPTIFQDHPLQYQRSYLIMYWLAMSNSMYNPIIIFFMNSKFRHEFKKILSLMFCCEVYVPPIRPGNAGQLNSHSSHFTQNHTNNLSTNNNACGRNRRHRFKSRQQSTRQDLNRPHSTRLVQAEANESEPFSDNPGSKVGEQIKHNLQIQLKSRSSEEIEPFFKLPSSAGQSNVATVITVTIDS